EESIEMKKIAIAMLAVAGLGLSGCYTTASPEGVVRSAAKALSKNDVKKFPKFLTGEAKLQYGNLQGMADLQSQLSKYSEAKLGAVDLVETDVDSAGKEVRRLYTVEVNALEGAD